MTTIAINGFGRIGRLVFRALVEQGHLGTTFNVAAVGDIVPADNLAYLLKYDSTQGRFSGTVSSKKSSPSLEEDDIIVVNGHEIRVVSARTPDGLPWKELGVDVVIESTGLFTEAEKAKGHITAGAKNDAIVDHITEVWAVRKPTSDGHVTSLEAFSADNKMIIQFFGQREEGKGERAGWRDLVESLPRLDRSNAA